MLTLKENEINSEQEIDEKVNNKPRINRSVDKETQQALGHRRFISVFVLFQLSDKYEA